MDKNKLQFSQITPKMEVYAALQAATPPAAGWIKAIRSELDEFEQKNIEDAIQRTLTARVKSPQALLSDQFVVNCTNACLGKSGAGRALFAPPIKTWGWTNGKSPPL